MAEGLDSQMPLTMDSVTGKRTYSQSFLFLWSYLLFLFTFQITCAYVYARSPYLRNAISLPVAFRLTVWTLPILVFLKCAKRDVLEYLFLRSNIIRGVVWGIVLGCCLITINLLGAYLSHGRVTINSHFGANQWIGPVIMVGFSEEVVFRGYLLNDFAERTRFWVANLGQAGVFLGIHIAGWIVLHQFVFPVITRGLICVFAMGLLLAALKKRTGSLWSCMILHSFSNFSFFAIH